MYSLAQVKRGLASPNLLLRECNRIYCTRFDTRSFNVDGVDVWESSGWDETYNTVLPETVTDATRDSTHSENSGCEMSPKRSVSTL